MPITLEAQLTELSTAHCSSDGCSATSHTIYSSGRARTGAGTPQLGFLCTLQHREHTLPVRALLNSSHRAEILSAWGPVENTRGDKTATNGFGISESHGSPWLDPRSIDVLCMKQSSSKFLQYPGLI